MYLSIFRSSVMDMVGASGSASENAFPNAVHEHFRAGHAVVDVPVDASHHDSTANNISKCCW